MGGYGKNSNSNVLFSVVISVGECQKKSFTGNKYKTKEVS